MSRPEGKKLAIYNIQRHNFEAAKQSLQKYTEMNQQSIDFAKIDPKIGPFGMFDRKVTGSELNKLTAQIQNHLVEFNGIHQKLVDEFRQVYMALDALDKEYIKAILSSIKAIEEVNRKTEDNQQDIQKTIDNQAKTIKVLTKHSKEILVFNEKISSLEHIMDIDKAWKLIEEQKKTIRSLQQHKEELCKIKHLSDMDRVWSDTESLKKTVDILNKNLPEISKVVDSQGSLIHEITENLKRMGKSQQEALISMYQTLNEYKAALETQVEMLSTSQQEQFDLMKKTLAEDKQGINDQIASLREALVSVHQTLSEYKAALETQVEMLSISQREQFDLMKKTLAEDKQRINDQIASFETSHRENMAELVQSLAEEKSALNERLEAFSKQLKVAYIVAGGTAVLSVVHAILNMVGIL